MTEPEFKIGDKVWVNICDEPHFPNYLAGIITGIYSDIRKRRICKHETIEEIDFTYTVRVCDELREQSQYNLGRMNEEDCLRHAKKFGGEK